MGIKQEFTNFLLNLKHNRDYYSSAKIIELIEEKYNELHQVKKNVDLTDVSKSETSVCKHVRGAIVIKDFLVYRECRWCGELY